MDISYSSFIRRLETDRYRNYEEIRCLSLSLSLSLVLHIYLLHYAEVAGGFTCPAAGEVSGASGSFSRHAHPEDCRKYYICLEGIAREYGCPIGTVFKIGDSDGSGACEDPEDVPGWWASSLIRTHDLISKLPYLQSCRNEQTARLRNDQEVSKEWIEKSAINF